MLTGKSKTDSPASGRLLLAVRFPQRKAAVSIAVVHDRLLSTHSSIPDTHLGENARHREVSDADNTIDPNNITELMLDAWCGGGISYHHVADLQVPIGCAGIAVYPGDVIVGDTDGLTLVPAHLAAELADVCLEQDDIENYLAMRIVSGEALWGVYPPSPEAVAAYQDWVASGRPTIPSD
jgi:hypothetical protein